MGSLTTLAPVFWFYSGFFPRRSRLSRPAVGALRTRLQRDVPAWTASPCLGLGHRARGLRFGRRVRATPRELARVCWGALSSPGARAPGAAGSAFLCGQERPPASSPPAGHPAGTASPARGRERAPGVFLHASASRLRVTTKSSPFWYGRAFPPLTLRFGSTPWQV